MSKTNPVHLHLLNDMSNYCIDETMSGFKSIYLNTVLPHALTSPPLCVSSGMWV